MKCRSIACIWSDSPPVHRVTATAVLNQPPTLYTGGADGTIVWWNLSSSPHSNHEIKPIAMLCGHAASIADLGICYPAAIPGHDMIDDQPSNVVPKSNSVNYGALISACTDGVLCVWSRVSGHCRKRRRLPPWVGSPSIVRTLPDNCRYVCIACDSIHSSDHWSLDENRELQQRKPSKCTVVIVDSYTLTIVQTVFHGNLSIGPLKFMSVILNIGDMEKQSVLLADSFGKVQCVSIINDADPKGKNLSGAQKVLELSDLVHGTNEGLLVAFATSGQVLALVYNTYCIFKLVDDGTIIGEISFSGDQFCAKDGAGQSHVTGGMFLECRSEEPNNTFLETFVVWNNMGYAIIYSISYSTAIFKSESLFTIPAISYPSMKLSVCFIQLNSYLLRIESTCFHSEEPLPWKPRVTIWLLPQLNVSIGKLSQECKMLGKAGVFDEWNKPDDLLVSSSMVISENYLRPYAIVYGYNSGEIEVVHFHMFFEGLNDKQADSDTSRTRLLGHTGAVLCLVAHHIGNNSKITSFKRVLVSGSMDCTVRIWDLDSNNPISVMHQHVAPVRQIILPPPRTYKPWNDCFISVGDDFCVAVISLETMRVERLFPGHPYYPAKVVWDSTRGYIACLCLNDSLTSDLFDVLYIWDMKTGARERVLRGTAAHSMFDHFYTGINVNLLSGNTSASSFLFPMFEDASFSHSHLKNPGKGASSSNIPSSTLKLIEPNHLIKCFCPFPGISTLSFDLASLISLCKNHEFSGEDRDKSKIDEVESETPKKGYGGDNTSENDEWIRVLERCLLQFALSILHLWNVDTELDKLLVADMKLKRPDNFMVASGLLGDRGSLTLTFPGSSNTLELWKWSSEFCAMRSLAMVSLAQNMVSLSHSCSASSSALAAFYTRNFAEKIPDIKPPLLQLLVSFWQDETEHVRMAARSLFHCAASRAIPAPLASSNKIAGSPKSEQQPEKTVVSQADKSEILSWLESFEVQDWISCVGGTSQDAMTSHIIVAASLAVWYPSLVKPSLAALTVHPLMKLVMAMNEKYSSTAAEILAEGMESTWKACILSEIPRLIGDIFFQIECVSGASASSMGKNPATSFDIKETLIGVLLPSLAMADIPGFLHVIERQIWSTASDSPVHVVSLKTLIRVVRGSPRNLAQYLDKVVNFILQTMDPGNSVMRKTCLRSSMVALKDVVRVYPMVALNDTSTQLAVGDALGEIRSASIRVYEMLSMTTIKVLDASGPPGLPHLLGGAPEVGVTVSISALSFAPNGEGIVAFSEHGLMIRWWSLESVWWEKISRNLVPVQCTKLIFVPPWEGFSPNSTRSSIMANTSSNEKQFNLQENTSLSEVDRIKLLIHNLDLSYRLEWVGERKVLLRQHGQELGTFLL